MYELKYWPHVWYRLVVKSFPVRLRHFLSVSPWVNCLTFGLCYLIWKRSFIRIVVWVELIHKKLRTWLQNNILEMLAIINKFQILLKNSKLVWVIIKSQTKKKKIVVQKSIRTKSITRNTYSFWSSFFKEKKLELTFPLIFTF